MTDDAFQSAVSRYREVETNMKTMVEEETPAEDFSQEPPSVYAEKEELFDNKDHAKLAYERIPNPNKKYVEVPNITHYGIYTTERERAIKLAIEWFDQHLKN